MICAMAKPKKDPEVPGVEFDIKFDIEAIEALDEKVKSALANYTSVSKNAIGNVVGKFAGQSGGPYNQAVNTNSIQISGRCYICNADPCQCYTQNNHNHYYTSSGIVGYTDDEIVELKKSRDNLLVMVETLTKLYQDLLDRVAELEESTDNQR